MRQYHIFKILGDAVSPKGNRNHIRWYLTRWCLFVSFNLRICTNPCADFAASLVWILPRFRKAVCFCSGGLKLRFHGSCWPRTRHSSWRHSERDTIFTRKCVRYFSLCFCFIYPPHARMRHVVCSCTVRNVVVDFFNDVLFNTSLKYSILQFSLWLVPCRLCQSEMCLKQTE